MAGRGQPAPVEGGAMQDGRRIIRSETRMRMMWMEKKIKRTGLFAYMCDHRRGMDPSGTT
jgi:hypothetical protein